jgi:hypothetical protein
MLKFITDNINSKNDCFLFKNYEKEEGKRDDIENCWQIFCVFFKQNNYKTFMQQFLD